MDLMRLSVAFVLAATLLAPMTTAHTSYVTPDNQVRVVVGNLNEPSSTYMKTGLDLILQVNNATRDPITINPGDLTAVLYAPDGSHTLTQDLKAQHGKPGSYTFTDPYYLTQPGQYVLKITGTINGSPIDTSINVAGPVPPIETLGFPDQTMSPLQMQEKINGLETEVAQLKAQLQSMQESKKDLPGVSGLALLGTVLGVALLARRKTA